MLSRLAIFAIAFALGSSCLAVDKSKRWIEEAESGFFLSFDADKSHLCLRAKRDERSLTVEWNAVEKFDWELEHPLRFDHIEYPAYPIIVDKWLLLTFNRMTTGPIPDCEPFELQFLHPQIMAVLGIDSSVSKAAYEGVPISVTLRDDSVKRFLLSRGHCPVDTTREESLSRAENEAFGRVLKESVVSTRKMFDLRVAELKVVSYPFKQAVWSDDNKKPQRFYLIDDLRSLFNETRQSLVANIESEKAAALVAYIEAKVPDEKVLRQNSFSKDSRLISKESGDRLIGSVEYVFQKLTTAAENIALDLRVISIPDPVNVTLRTMKGLELRGTSEAPIRNVYRGIYTVIVEKFGFKTIAYDINFIDRPGDTLDCHKLVPENDVEQAHNCDLK
jgi:hypothetical protein